MQAPTPVRAKQAPAPAPARTMQASPADFNQCAPEAQEFVQVPTVEHIMVEQPVTFKQYKKKTSYVSVPVVQKYSKVMMGHQEMAQGCEQQAPKQMYSAQSCSRSGPYTPGVYDGEMIDPFRASPYQSPMTRNYHYANPQQSHYAQNALSAAPPMRSMSNQYASACDSGSMPAMPVRSYASLY